MQEKISHTVSFPGLNKPEIKQLQKEYGKNVFRAGRHAGFLRIIWDILKEPMFIMLVAACALYFILSKANEGFLMLAAMVFVAGISVYQEVKSSRALETLKQYIIPKIVVIREGREQVIDSEDLVPGDIMILEEGNRIPADAQVVQANDLTVNESVITGESMPVEKSAYGEFNKLFQGSTINSGRCYARVMLTGNRTMLGKLGKSVSALSQSRTLLQIQIARFVRFMAFFGLTAFAIIWLVNYIHNRDVLQSLLLGLTLAMSAVPEEIPVAFSSFMALGASHMARIGIITRQSQTIENLGAVSVICLDKTGTITLNKMRVKKVYDAIGDRILERDGLVPWKDAPLMRYAWLACEKDPFDAMEKAIAEAYLEERDPAIDIDLQMVHEYPLEGRPPMMTHIWQSGMGTFIAAKGAPERILRICDAPENQKQLWKSISRDFAADGYRVLGVCSATDPSGDYPAKQDDFHWEFLGLVALYDPPKDQVGRVFEKWYDAGIQLKLITGDFAQTATTLAQQVGIQNQGVYLNGDQVMEMPMEELQQKISSVQICARMFPEAKLKVIEALKKNNETVAMTGDGVNDGPALKSAHIGIAMGHAGTELAKEAADLIITDDNLDKITEAIRQGRKIYSNFRKAIRYIISIHIPIILTASFPVLLSWKYPNIFTPIHIIFLELIMGPTCSIFFEREPVEAMLMYHPPRPPGQNIFSGKELWLSIFQGLIIAAGTLGLYYYFMNRDYPIQYVRGIVFTTLLVSNVWLTFTNRSFEESILQTIKYKNSLAPYIFLITLFFLGSLQFIPWLSRLFEMGSISLTHYLLCIGLSLICVGWFELYKIISKRSMEGLPAKGRRSPRTQRA